MGSFVETDDDHIDREFAGETLQSLEQGSEKVTLCESCTTVSGADVVDGKKRWSPRFWRDMSGGLADERLHALQVPVDRRLHQTDSTKPNLRGTGAVFPGVQTDPLIVRPSRLIPKVPLGQTYCTRPERGDAEVLVSWEQPRIARELGHVATYHEDVSCAHVAALSN